MGTVFKFSDNNTVITKPNFDREVKKGDKFSYNKQIYVVDETYFNLDTNHLVVKCKVLIK